MLNEAVELSPAAGGLLPYVPLSSLAEVLWASGEREQAIDAMQEAVRVCRAVIDRDDGPGWSATDLPELLSTLAGYLQAAGRDGAIEVLLTAIASLEQRLDRQPGRYPVELVDALRRLAELALTNQAPELAVGAYARALELAAPYPARDSEPVLALAQQLDALCDRSGVVVKDGLERYAKGLGEAG